MSFDGIYLWHREEGMPTSYDDARRIVGQLSPQGDATTTTNHQAFMAVAQAVEDFAKQAIEFYDDLALESYTRMTQWMTDFAEPMLSFDQNPEEVEEAFSAVIIDAANRNNLVVLHEQIEVVFLPDDRVLTHNDPDIWSDFAKVELDNWQKKIHSLRADSLDDSEPQQLPETSALVKRFVNRIIQERLKQAGVKAKKSHATGYIVDKEGYTIELSVFPEVDLLYKYDEDKIRISNSDFLDIEIPGLRQDFHHNLNRNFIRTNSIAYYKKEPKILIFDDVLRQNLNASIEDENMADHLYLASEEEINCFDTVQGYTHYLHQCADMFIDIVTQAEKGIGGLYWFIKNNRHSQELKLHDKYPDDSYFLPQPEFILALAKLSNQPNFEQLITSFRQDYIDCHLLLEQMRHERALLAAKIEKSRDEVEPLAPETERRQKHADMADYLIDKIENPSSKEE